MRACKSGTPDFLRALDFGHMLFSSLGTQARNGSAGIHSLLPGTARGSSGAATGVVRGSIW